MNSKMIHTQSLNGRWTLQQVGDCSAIPATVPGCVHTDLLTARAIEDPFYRDNEDKQRWIYKADWIYRRMFKVSRHFLMSDRLLLRCEGLDTVATIRINGQDLAETDNMFRTWEFDVKSLVHAGENEVEIRFESPLNYMQRQQRIREIAYPFPPRQISAFSIIRKEACSFGWDWGPTFATCGIWRPISLLAFNTARLSDVLIRQDHSVPQCVKLNIAVEVEQTQAAALFVQATLSINGEVISRQRQSLRDGRADLGGDVKNPMLWWPINMGSQHLYELVVAIVDAQGRVLDRQSHRIGLRTLNLVREKDEWGESFCFQVNGVPFFAKGANWIPADAFATRMTPPKNGELLKSAADANMNMIRVWGGGLYESDDFYDACDELGLCVWQDFMFACAPYPIDVPAFIENTEIEMAQNVRRLRHHACLALWCGNNEIELCGFVATDQGDAMHMSLKHYRDFFERRIPELLAKLNPECCYWPSSPYKEEGDRYNPDVWIDSPTRGDAHLWEVWGGRKPFEFYREYKHRFISEFGFQSFPEPTTVRTFTKPADRNISSYVMEHHQRHPVGNSGIMQYMLDWFRMPSGFEMTLWQSQLLQALAMKIACEHWRRAMPRTMGTLIWQLNDTWPSASWSTLDYFGQWKATHYFARRFFSPLLMSAVADESLGIVQVHVTSDLQKPVEGLLRWALSDLAGQVLRKGQQEVTAAPRCNTPMTSLAFEQELAEVGARNLLLWLELTAEGQPASRDLILFAKPKHLELLDPEMSVRTVSDENGDFVVTLQAEKPALWAWLEIPGRHLTCSDQFVHLEPRQAVEIRVTPAKAMSLSQFTRALKVRSLFNVYSIE